MTPTNSLTFCRRCLLPSNYPKIEIFSDGFCNVCRDHQAKWNFPPKPKGMKALKNHILSVIPKDNQYQAVVTISGGRDSSYVLYLAVKKLKLRIMAANFDNGFQSPLALKNIKRITEFLKVPLLTFKIPVPELYGLYKRFWYETGDFCTPCCIGCCASGFYVAKAANTNVILHGGIGGSPYSSNVLGFLNHSYGRYMKHAQGANSDFILKSIAFSEDEIKKFTLISFPQYLDWREKVVVNKIKKELGWVGTQVEHSDCLVDCVSDYYLVKKFGISKLWLNTSMLLRTNQITLGKAMKQLSKDGQVSRGKLLLFSHKILKTRPKSHTLYHQSSLYPQLLLRQKQLKK